ncbi:MAG: ADP-ribosylglycohydrolase family protein [Euzebya sp.]
MSAGIDLDRAAGALLGGAAGDALGAGYEFTTPAENEPITMRGGGPFGFEPGEWTDDTAQAAAIAQITATGSTDLVAIGQRFLDWYATGPKDVGNSTRAVLSGATDAGDLPRAAAAYFARHPRGGAGNGSLMRTAAVALAHLGDDQAIARLAMDISALTHGDPLAGEACVVWCIAIDRAVREGRLDGLREGLDMLSGSRRSAWAKWITQAEEQPPAAFHDNNGFVVVALQAAWSAIHHTPVPLDRPVHHLQEALTTAVRIGGDTDTVAAIAGQLLGARWGAWSIPSHWRRALHGWPDVAGTPMDAEGLVRLAVLTATRGAQAM